MRQYLGYRMSGFAAGLHRGLPSQHLTFIVSIGPSIDVVAQCDPTDAPGSYRCVVGGLQRTHAVISHDGHQEGVAIELTPVGARAVLGRPAKDLLGLSVELADVVGAPGGELWERLQVTHGWRDRFGICDEVLGRLLVDDVPEPTLVHAWRLISEAPTPLGVGAVAAEVGWSRQHLTRRFRDEFGLTPKVAARVVRFERARRLLSSGGPGMSLSDVAVRCGYFDQSHLHRDFGEFAGCSPLRWMREELPFVHDEQAAEPSGSWT